MDGRTNEETDVLMEKLTVVEQNSPRCDAAFCLCPIKITPGLYHPAGDVLWVFVEPGNVVP